MSTELFQTLSGLHKTDQAIYDKFKGDVNYVLNGNRNDSTGEEVWGEDRTVKGSLENIVNLTMEVNSLINNQPEALIEEGTILDMKTIPSDSENYSIKAGDAYYVLLSNDLTLDIVGPSQNKMANTFIIADCEGQAPTLSGNFTKVDELQDAKVNVCQIMSFYPENSQPMHRLFVVDAFTK